MTNQLNSSVSGKENTCCQATQFAQQIAGMTNEQITAYLRGKPVNYVDNTVLDHSGEYFDPVKFFFTDGSILFIFDWNEETPVMRVYEQLLTNTQLISAYSDETGDFDHFSAQLIDSLHALAISDFPGQTLQVEVNLTVEGLLLQLSTDTFVYNYTLVAGEDRFNPGQLIAEVSAAYQLKKLSNSPPNLV
jgi:hypothetical protein